MKKYILLILASIFFGISAAHAANSALEFHPISNTAAGAGSKLDSNVILDARDIIRAEVDQDGSTFNVKFTLNTAGTTKLREYSKAKAGAKLGLVIDGKLTNTPQIKSPITGDSFTLSGLSRAEADNIIHHLK